MLNIPKQYLSNPRINNYDKIMYTIFLVGTPIATIIAINSRKESDFAFAGAAALLLFNRVAEAGYIKGVE